nr:DEAD/DEAH box helicase family protein [Paenibacillus sp. BK720]
MVLKRRQRNVYGLEKKLHLYSNEMGDIIAPRGFAGEMQDILRAQGVSQEKVISWQQTERPPVDFGGWNQDYQPRDYQAPAIKAATEKGGVLIAPAGSGKTLMACAVLRNWGQPALWLTHTKELLYQSAAAAEKFLLGVGKVGVIGDNKLEWGSGKLIVATIQTLDRNPTLVNTLNGIIGAVVIDEAHHFPAVQFVETAAKFTAAKFLGVTATPNRKDFLESYMYRGIGPACYEVKREALHEAGSLILPELKFVYTEYRRPENELAEDNIDAGGEDVSYTQMIAELIADDKRAQLVAEKVLESCIEAAPQGGAVIVLADSVRYLWKLQELVLDLAAQRLGGQIPRMAVVHGGLQRHIWRNAKNAHKAQQAVDSGKAVEWRNKNGVFQMKIEQYTAAEFNAWQVTAAQRKHTMEAAYDRQIDILFATGQLVREGLDMPHLSRGHLATPSRGDARASANGAGVEQAIGRIQRPDPQNPHKKAVWYDYVDFEVGVFQDQYYSRRTVYKRLGITLPKKPKSQRDKVNDFLRGDFLNFGSLPL